MRPFGKKDVARSKNKPRVSALVPPKAVKSSLNKTTKKTRNVRIALRNVRAKPRGRKNVRAAKVNVGTGRRMRYGRSSIPRDGFYLTVGGLTFQVLPRRNQRWKNFMTIRRMFRVHLVHKEEGANHFLDMMMLDDSLRVLVTEVIEHVRANHRRSGRSLNALAMLSLQTEGMDSPINTSIGKLFSDSIVHDMFARLQNMLQSKNNIKVQDGFFFDVLVVDDQERPDAFHIAGTGRKYKHFRGDSLWKFTRPKNWKKSLQSVAIMPDLSADPELKDKCLLAAIVYSMSYNKSRRLRYGLNCEKDTFRFQEINRLTTACDEVSGSNRRRIRVHQRKFRTLMFEYAERYNLDLSKFENAELNEELEEELKKLNVNVVIVTDSSNFRPVFTCPDQHDTKRETVWILLVKLGEDDVRHAASILRPYAKMDNGRALKNHCLICRKDYAPSYFPKHRCRKGGKKCSLCRRRLLKPEDYVDCEVIKTSCAASLGKVNCAKNCKSCNAFFEDQHCLTAHRKYCSGNMAFCVKCRKTYKKDKVHLCHSVFCRACLQRYSIHETPEKAYGHQCEMKRPKPQKAFHRLAIFDTETVTCPESSRHRVNALGLSFESSENPGTFSEIYFYDDSMNHPEDSVLHDKTFMYNYMSSCKNWQETGQFQWTMSKRAKRFTIPQKGKGKKKKREEECGRVNEFFNLEAAESDRGEEGEEEEYEDGETSFLAGSEPGSDEEEVFDDCDTETECDSENSELSALDKFFEFVLRPEFANYTFIAHASSKFDSILCLSWFFRRNVTVKPIFDGSKLLMLEIPMLNIRFIDSYRFVKIPLAKFPKRFPQMVTEPNIKSDIEEETKKENLEKGIFPFRANVPEMYDYDGELLNEAYFTDEFTSVQGRKKYEEFKKNWPDGQKWNFKKELHKYLVQDVRVLRGGLLCLQEEFFAFQAELIEEKGDVLKLQYAEYDVVYGSVFGCFTPPFFTASSYVHR